MNTELIPANAAGVKPANWAPCIAMMGVSLISYIDRSVLSILSPTILRDLQLSATQYGLAVSAFSICYTVGNPIWGYVIDRAGLYWSIAAAVAIWSLASGAHALVYGLGGLWPCILALCADTRRGDAALGNFEAKTVWRA